MMRVSFAELMAIMLPPNRADDEAPKPVPLIVIETPPWLGLDEGVIDEITGAALVGTTVKPTAMATDRRKCGIFIMCGKFENVN